MYVVIQNFRKLQTYEFPQMFRAQSLDKGEGHTRVHLFYVALSSEPHRSMKLRKNGH